MSSAGAWGIGWWFAYRSVFYFNAVLGMVLFYFQLFL
jgi:hypothetical protein